MGPDEADDDEPLAQIEDVCEEGIHIALDDGDVFLPFAWFPVIANAPVSRIFDVRIRRPGHLFWPSLDFEVPIASLPPWTVQYAARGAVREGSVRETPALFGSVTRDDFTPQSDVDVLVEFEPDRIPGLIKLAGYEIELSEILGRQVDMNTPRMIQRYRDEVLVDAVLEYDAEA